MLMLRDVEEDVEEMLRDTALVGMLRDTALVGLVAGAFRGSRSFIGQRKLERLA
jgi:hypothetical protein